MSISFLTPIKNYNGYTYYDQSSVPSSPVVGDKWTERDGSGNVIKRWYYNGSIWLAQDPLIRSFFNAVQINTGLGSVITGVNQSYNIFLKDILCTFYNISINNSASIYWTYAIKLMYPDGSYGATSYYSWNDSPSGLTSIGGTMSAPFTISPNVLIDLSSSQNSPIIALQLTGTGSPNYYPALYFIWTEARR